MRAVARPLLQRLGNFSAPGRRHITSITQVKVSNPDRGVDIYFQDGGAYRFHSLWLRDACRDEPFLKKAAGERILATTVLVAGCPEDLHATKVEIDNSTNGLHVEWNDGKAGRFDAAYLRTYADTVAKPLVDTPPRQTMDISWLDPYTGLPEAPAAKDSDLILFKNDGSLKIPEFTIEQVKTPEGNLQMIQSILKAGIVRVSGIQNPNEATLHDFCDSCVGGMQKDASRKEPHWIIEKKPDFASVSYNHDVRLNNHTDQSLPNHGIPGLCLVIQYSRGHGVNTIVDTWAVGKALRERDPKAFKLLTQYANDQERFVVASRADAAQTHQGGGYLSSGKPIIQVDANGNIVRTQYNEVFRTAATVPYDVFQDWYQAYLKWASMCHDEEFECNLALQAGQLVVFHNWRVMHGRGGNRDGSVSRIQSADRVLMGGTVTRESIYSTARQLLTKVHGIQFHGPRLFI
jgi:hypothetical protein